MRIHLDSKIVTTELGNKAGISSVPNLLGRASSYAELMKLAGKARLGKDLVVQTPYGDSGRTTFFVASETDWDKYADKMASEPLKVMKRINHLPGTIEGVRHPPRHARRDPCMTDITGFGELTPYKGGWCGNDVFVGGDEEGARGRAAHGPQARRPALQGGLSRRLLHGLPDRYRHAARSIWASSTRASAAPARRPISSPRPMAACPIYLFHLLEFMDVDWEVDLEAIQKRWTEFDEWSQLILKHPGDAVELISKAPASGIWRMAEDGSIKSRAPHPRLDQRHRRERGLLPARLHGGDYRYHGADMGILVARGRMQTDERRLLERAKKWAAGINGQFQCVPLPPEMPVHPPEADSINKMY